MTKEEFAAMLNGREYGSEITKAEDKEAAELGLLVVFGYSDDNMEFRGCIYDEVEAYGGCKVYVTNHLKLKNKPKVGRKLIEAVFAPDEPIGATWLIKTEIPHATFDIMEDVEIFCRGVVIHVVDLFN